MTCMELGRYADALKYRQHFKQVRPTDWRGIANLIQTYQALGNMQMRDTERQALFQLHQTSSDPEVHGLKSYCRDRFMINHHRVLAFESFNPLEDAGPLQGMHTVYRFVVEVAAPSKQIIALETDDSETKFWQESGKITKDQRVYSLDVYNQNSHELLTFYTEEPSYERVRGDVEKILHGMNVPFPLVTP